MDINPLKHKPVSDGLRTQVHFLGNWDKKRSTTDIHFQYY